MMGGLSTLGGGSSGMWGKISANITSAM